MRRRSKSPELDGFYLVAVDVITDKHAWPDYGKNRCRKGVCQGCGSRHRWSSLHDLVTVFWDHKGDIDATWKLAAELHGFSADVLHDLLLAVFIGSERSERSPLANWRTYVELDPPYEEGPREPGGTVACKEGTPK